MGKYDGLDFAMAGCLIWIRELFKTWSAISLSDTSSGDKCTKVLNNFFSVNVVLLLMQLSSRLSRLYLAFFSIELWTTGSLSKDDWEDWNWYADWPIFMWEIIMNHYDQQWCHTFHVLTIGLSAHAQKLSNKTTRGCYTRTSIM